MTENEDFAICQLAQIMAEPTGSGKILAAFLRDPGHIRVTPHGGRLSEGLFFPHE
jgi:hypothetical protein